jgi:hypothetical protein
MLSSLRTLELLRALLLYVYTPSTVIPGAVIGACCQILCFFASEIQLLCLVCRYSAACMLGCNPSPLSIFIMSETVSDSWKYELSAGMSYYEACSAVVASCGWSPGAILQMASTPEFPLVCSLVQVCSDDSFCMTYFKCFIAE